MKASEIIVGIIALIVFAAASVWVVRALWRSRRPRSREDEPALWI